MRAAVALVVLAAAVARAGDGDEVKKKVEEALARGDRAAALAVLDEVIEPGAPRSRPKSLAAAQASVDVVGGPDGNLRAARIIVDALKLDRADAELHAFAMRLSKRLWDVDLPAEQELLRGLVRIYPEELDFSNDLATEYRHAGLSDMALAQYTKIKDIAASDRPCRYELALMYELRGDVDAAIKEYDELIALRDGDAQPELNAHRLKARLLLDAAHDLAAARKALDVAAAAAQGAAPGRERDWYVDVFKSMKSDLEEQERTRRELRDLRGKLDAAMLGTAAAWIVVLGGGLMTLRRAKWI
jgi:tetratricopeptide (TPR) repeat protein